MKIETVEDFKNELIRLTEMGKGGLLCYRNQERLKTLKELENLILFGVGITLPTDKKMEFLKLGMIEGLKAKGYDKTNINDFTLGFENCLHFYKLLLKENGN